MKKWLPKVVCVLAAVCFAGTGVIAAGAVTSAGQEPAPLRFQEDSKFTIMQIADVQEYGKVNKDALRVMNAALDRVQPDLVVFTGDQVEGYASYFQYGDREARVRRTIDNVLEPLDRQGIPFAVVFGNHDQESGVSKEKQMEMYQAHPGCLAVDEGAAAFGCGTYNLPIQSSDGASTALNLYFVDSNSSVPQGGYDNVHADQIALCRELSDGLKAGNNGRPVPSLLFQHIPVEELYSVLKEVPEGTEGARKWYRNLKPGSFMIDEQNQVGLDKDTYFYREPIASPNENSGQFQSWVEQGDIIGAYFGHDHINHFAGTYEGIDLGYGLGTSYNAYGAGKEGGVQVFVIDETAPQAYETYGLTYQSLCGDKMLDPIASFCSTRLSFPATELGMFGGMGLAAAALVVAALVILIKAIKKHRKTKEKTLQTMNS